MSNYVKSTNFTAKDSLPTGDTNKVIRGSEFDTEFNAIATAVATKSDLAGPTFTGTATFDGITATGTVNFTGGSVTTNIDGGTIDGVTIGGSTPGAGTFTAVAGTTGTFSGAVSGTTGTFSGAVTGSNLNVTNWNTAYGWGDHSTQGYLTSVTFSDMDAGAVTTSGETFANSDTQIPTNAAVRNWVLTTYPTIVELNDLTANVTWANVPDANITQSSVTQHQAALSIAASQLSDVTSTAAELNVLDGITATTAELNYTDGVTSNIQTQLDSKVGASYTGDVDITGELLVDSYNETFKRVTSSSNATTVNCENANVFEHVLTENTTFTFSNPPASGTPVLGSFTLSTASYDSVSFSVASQETSPTGVTFNSDGTKMYIVGTVNDTVYQYSLSTAYNVSTASYDSVSLSVTSQDTAPNDLVFSSDGTKLYISGATNNAIYQYTLTTAFDLSTASYASKSLSISSQDTGVRGAAFKTDGTKLYVLGDTNDSVFQYSLSTAWDLSTGSYDSVSFSISSQDTNAQSIVFNSDGTKMLIAGNINDKIFQYSLSTAFDLSTASYDSVSLTISQEATPTGLTINNNDSKIYVVGFGNDTVYQYTTRVSTLNDSTAYAMSLKVVQDSGASGYTVTWPTSVDWPSATAPTLTATASAVDQFVFYTHDGGTTWYGFTAGQALG